MSKQTLICLHGFTHNGRFFEKLAKYLTSEGWMVICPTFLGRGDQEYVEAKEYNYRNYVNYLEQITTKLDRFSILGSSMGGLVAMMYADKNPGKIQNLMLNDVGNYISSDAITKIGKFVSPKTQYKNKEALNERLQEEFKESNLDKEELDFLKDIYTENNCIKYDPNISKAFWRGEKQRRIPDFDHIDMWDRIVKKNPNMNISIIRGKNSEFLTREVAKNMSKNENITVTELENRGHLPLFFKQDEIKLISNLLNASFSK